MRTILPALLLCLAVACAPAPPTPNTQEVAEPVQHELPRPNVEMRADPPPPLTYWAPEGSVITNHPHVTGIWFADLNGVRVATYFGDQCGASQLQHLVGQPLSATSTLPPGLELRTFCTACAHTDDLRRERVNIAFDETTQVIQSAACF